MWTSSSITHDAGGLLIATDLLAEEHAAGVLSWCSFLLPPSFHFMAFVSLQCVSLLGILPLVTYVLMPVSCDLRQLTSMQHIGELQGLIFTHASMN